PGLKPGALRPIKAEWPHGPHHGLRAEPPRSTGCARGGHFVHASGLALRGPVWKNALNSPSVRPRPAGAKRERRDPSHESGDPLIPPPRLTAVPLPLRGALG